MYPDQQPQQQPESQPEQRPPYQPPTTGQPIVAPKKSLTLPIILMVWPGATLILVIFLYAVSNMAFIPPEGELFGDTPPLQMIINVCLFIFGGAALTLGPISFIFGLVMLIQRKSKR